LSPQGKILADPIILAEAEGVFRLLVQPALAADLARRLTLYRLRAKAEIRVEADAAARLSASASEGAPDPRDPGLGRWRLGGADETAQPVPQARRIASGLPQGGLDFAYGDAYPHEINLDQLGAVDFRKGCYVGQEVVSRTEHRAAARTRLLMARFDGSAPPEGAEIVAGGRVLGRVGGCVGNEGLALVRLDRLADARAAGEAVTAGGVGVAFAPPPYARFPLEPPDRPAPA
jgi:folate-binding protein YgfZ